MNRYDWVLNTSGRLVDLIPIPLEDAKVLVEAYLTDTAGGWVPDDGGSPLGEGEPDSEETPEAAAQAIADNQIGDTKMVQITVPVNVTVTFTGSFPTGTSTTDIVNAGKSQIETLLQDQVFGSGIEYESVTWGSATTTTRFGGALSQTSRAAVQAEILANINLVDPAAIAVSHIRYKFGLGDTWMTSKLYTRDNFSIVAWVRKYTTNTYTTEDVSYVDGSETVTYPGYLVYISSTDLKIQSVLVYPRETRTPV